MKIIFADITAIRIREDEGSHPVFLFLDQWQLRLMSAQVTPAPIYETPTGKRAIYYFPSWITYERKVFPKDAPVGKITDISYAFMDVKADGTVYSRDEWVDFDNTFVGNSVSPVAFDAPAKYKGCLGQFMLLREAGHRFNMSMAIGGWTWSKYFSPAVSTPETRLRFVETLTAIFRRYPGLFNEISLDWEYLSNNNVNYGLEGNLTNPADALNFIELLKLINEKLPGFRIALCVGPAPEKVHLPIRDISGHIDFFHLMTYDFHSFFGETITAHHTNPRKSSADKYSVEEAADFYLGLGVPPEKIFVGGAFYSRGFSGTDGFGKPATGISTDFEFAVEPGILPYRMLPAPGATEYVDPESKGAYSWDPVKRIVNTFDNKDSLLEKIKIIHEKGLAGMIIWEIAGDIKDFDHPRCLRRFLMENLTHGNPPTSPPSTTTAKPFPSSTAAPVPVSAHDNLVWWSAGLACICLWFVVCLLLVRRK
jgi:chitinase